MELYSVLAPEPKGASRLQQTANVYKKISDGTINLFFTPSNQVGRVLEIFQSNKVLLDASGRHESVEEVDTASLIVRSTATTTSKWLLTNNGACTLFVVIHISRRVAQFVGCSDERLAIGRKSVRRRVINQKLVSITTYIDPVSA